MAAPGHMREAMPTIAAFIDDMRATFGASIINAAVRDGRQWGAMTEQQIADQLQRRQDGGQAAPSAIGGFWAIEGPGGWSYEGTTVIGHPFCAWPRGVKVSDLVLGEPNVKRPKR
jgi:hypothetical protein